MTYYDIVIHEHYDILFVFADLVFVGYTINIVYYQLREIYACSISMNVGSSETRIYF